MEQTASSPTANTLFLALKALAAVAELAMIAGVVYAAVTVVRYWPSINV